MSIGIVSPREAQALIAQGAKLIDVRDADEYLREHIPHAQLAPLSRLEQGDLPANLRAEQIIFHCQSGKRTSSNAAKLQAIAAPCSGQSTGRRHRRMESGRIARHRRQIATVATDASGANRRRRVDVAWGDSGLYGPRRLFPH